jgi:glycosyltransferase involved in cell wall biosynthesis
MKGGSVEMKLMTFAVPCFNSAAYMQKCIDSLLCCGQEDELEIIIINDGSTDQTAEIADEYASKYPHIVRVIHQPNGGHGEGINQGIRNATGLYFKVVDSDDWLDIECGGKLLTRVREQVQADTPVDLYICNFVYEHVMDHTQRFMRFSNVFADGEVIGWNETKPFGLSQFLSMHTLYYRTAVLRESGVVLPKHTFYVDSLLAYIPLPYVNTFCYLNLDLYRYFIGRSDQSITEENLVKRIGQQLMVNRILIEAYSSEYVSRLDIKLQHYMRNYIRALMAVGSSIALLSKKDEDFAKNKALWRLLQEKHPEWYRKIRYGSVALVNLPGKTGQAIGLASYRAARKILKFN